MNAQQSKKWVKDRPALTWGFVKIVLRTARNSGHDFKERSVVNSSFSKGVSFNIFWSGIKNKPNNDTVKDSKVWFVACNIIREFGAWAGIMYNSSNEVNLKAPHHEDPIEI